MSEKNSSISVASPVHPISNQRQIKFINLEEIDSDGDRSQHSVMSIDSDSSSSDGSSLLVTSDVEKELFVINSDDEEEEKEEEEEEDHVDERADNFVNLCETEGQDEEISDIEKSEALARQLMAEEAMASYTVSANYLQSNTNEISDEDMAVIRQAMEEERRENVNIGLEGGSDGFEYDSGDETLGVDEDLSYEGYLNLGELIGDVKQERWALIAKEEIKKLPVVKYCTDDQNTKKDGKDEDACAQKCLICQSDYEEGENLRVLPCSHRFHRDCIDQWLRTKGKFNTNIFWLIHAYLFDVLI